MTKNIEQHLNKLDLDIRKKPDGFSRFMDQKVTPDVLQFISECILNYVGSNTEKQFSISEIEASPYFRKNVIRNFSKPSPDDKRTEHEYDKFVSQPIKTLYFSKILIAKQVGKKYIYRIDSKPILEYISERPLNAYNFLYIYVTKVLKDSGFIKNLEEYRDKYLTGKLTKSDFGQLKKKFISFVIGNTNIKGAVEVRRIFPKILNVYSAENRLPGTLRGFMSKYPFLPSDLIYNRTNFRDKKKFKGISRQEAKATLDTTRTGKDNNLKYRIQRAKEHIKHLHGESEVQDQWANGEATQIHHIFPENEFPQIADRLENLVRLTPTQHNTKAHPSNKTHQIDKDYQFVCLIEKLKSIENSIKNNHFDYSKESFIGVINTGLGQNLPYNLTFDQIRTELKKLYTR